MNNKMSSKKATPHNSVNNMFLQYYFPPIMPTSRYIKKKQFHWTIYHNKWFKKIVSNIVYCVNIKDMNLILQQQSSFKLHTQKRNPFSPGKFTTGLNLPFQWTLYTATVITAAMPIQCVLCHVHSYHSGICSMKECCQHMQYLSILGTESYNSNNRKDL